MRTKMISVLTLVALSCGNAASRHETRATETVQANRTDTTFNFDQEEIGKLPSNWTAISTWVIVADSNNKALKQASRDGVFNICVKNSLNYKNLEMEVRIKALDGEEDQGGGLVWRYQDENNYYLARANPLENNFRMYKVENGSRSQLESAHEKMKTGEWFTIKIVMAGNNIDCYYNGQKLLSGDDDTFQKAGLVGLWSKADAVSLFDDLKIKVLK